MPIPQPKPITLSLYLHEFLTPQERLHILLDTFKTLSTLLTDKAGLSLGESVHFSFLHNATLIIPPPSPTDDLTSIAESCIAWDQCGGPSSPPELDETETINRIETALRKERGLL